MKSEKSETFLAKSEIFRNLQPGLPEILDDREASKSGVITTLHTSKSAFCTPQWRWYPDLHTAAEVSARNPPGRIIGVNEPIQPVRRVLTWEICVLYVPLSWQWSGKIRAIPDTSITAGITGIARASHRRERENRGRKKLAGPDSTSRSIQGYRYRCTIQAAGIYHRKMSKDASFP